MPILLRLLLLLLLIPSLHAESSLLVERECKRIAGKLASVSYRECLDRQLTVTTGNSVNQSPILARDFPATTGKRKGKVLLVGGIHGDEYATVTIVFKWMSLLEEFNAGLFEWRIVPLLNPDGLLQERSDRLNANGKDIARSFPVEDEVWLQQEVPEAQWLVESIQSFQPDAIIVLHAPHEIVDYAALKGGKYELHKLTANRTGQETGSLNHFASNNDIPVLTIELPYADIMPATDEIKIMWQDILDWVRMQTGEE